MSQQHARIIPLAPIAAKPRITPPIVLVLAQDDGLECYFYLQVTPEKLPLLRASLSQGRVNLSQHGTILTSGYGKPSAKVQQEMFDRYGFATEENAF